MTVRHDVSTFGLSFSANVDMRLWGDPRVTKEIHRIVTQTWARKWQAEFRRRWYRLVTEQSGLSGGGFTLARRGRLSDLNYEVINVVDYAEHVHRAGMKTPLVQLAVPRWVDDFAADCRTQITAFLRPFLRELVAERLRSAIGRRGVRRIA